MVVSSVSNAVAVTAVDNGLTNIETSIHRSIISLSRITRDFLNKKIELTRICRLAVLLKESGVNPDAIIYRKLASACVELQKDDGGWVDVLETMWCISLLNIFGEFSNPVEKAFKWLREQSNENGGWGKSIRDSGRIPVTGLILYFLPKLSSQRHLNWLENKWMQEWESVPCLTYKAAFTLLAFSENKYTPKTQDIIVKTIQWLCTQQNNDGGWSPWRDHPVGSDPWSTGICMVALLQYPNKIPKKVLLNAMKWLRENQLPNGLWRYHYIEEGSSWALYSMVKGYSLLNE